jgi:hypothetical protein
VNLTLVGLEVNRIPHPLGLPISRSASANGTGRAKKASRFTNAPEPDPRLETAPTITPDGNAWLMAP